MQIERESFVCLKSDRKQMCGDVAKRLSVRVSRCGSWFIPPSPPEPGSD